MVEYLWVFSHVGFFLFSVLRDNRNDRGSPRPISKGRVIMYIGGGLLTLVIVVVVVVLLLR